MARASFKTRRFVCIALLLATPCVVFSGCNGSNSVGGGASTLAPPTIPVPFMSSVDPGRACAGEIITLIGFNFPLNLEVYDVTFSDFGPSPPIELPGVVISVTAGADSAFGVETSLEVIVPTGALVGLDAVRAAAEGVIHSVHMVTRKPPNGLAGAPHLVENNISVENLETAKLVFEGTARDAAKGFPANVNVAAALSLAGNGPDQTTIEIWADPALERNTHTIRVDSDATRFEITIEGSTQEPATMAMLRAAAQLAYPNLEIRPVLSEDPDTPVQALVCLETLCLPPVSNPDDLAATVESALTTQESPFQNVLDLFPGP